MTGKLSILQRVLACAAWTGCMLLLLVLELRLFAGGGAA